VPSTPAVAGLLVCNRYPGMVKGGCHCRTLALGVIPRLSLCFAEIVRSLAALAKLCVIRLSPDKVHFIVPGNEGRDGVQVWS
jgi:hypothetical protein